MTSSLDAFFIVWSVVGYTWMGLMFAKYAKDTKQNVWVRLCGLLFWPIWVVLFVVMGFAHSCKDIINIFRD
jgi:hypothetical protein